MPVAIISSNRRRLTCMATTALALFLGAGAGTLYLGASPAAAATCAAGTCSLTFGQAGATIQEWEAPHGITEATFVVNGAGGGSNTYGDNNGPGGNGAQVTATIPVTGGDSLQLLVGTGGERTESSQGAAGGYGGGGDGGTGAQLGAPGGGGGSFVFGAGTPLIIAGGGGGAAVEPFPGGNGGQVGAYGGSYDENPGGEGASQSSGGLGGSGLATGASGTGPTTGPGALAEGGDGEGGGAKYAAGGGGGGYYGGGGGGAGGTGSAANEYSNTGGGGGSSYVTSSGANVTYSSGGGAGGVEAGAAEAGSITISFAQPTTGIALEATSLSPAVSSAETFIATVSPSPSSGTVAFTEGGSPIAGCGAVPVEGGEAACVAEYGSPGPRELLAEYSGSTDTVYPAAASTPLGFVVTSPTATSLGASSTSPAEGVPVTFTATVSPAPDSGTVTFEDGAGTLLGCAAVAVDVTTGGATCVTSFSTSGAHAITADFSGSLDGAFTASAAAALSVTVKAPSVTVTTASSAGTSTPTLTPTPTLLPTTPLATPRSPVFALSILTREAKPLLNRQVLAVRAGCGAVACAVQVRISVKLPGVGKTLSVGSAATKLRAGEAGNALIAVPAKLRSTVRSYLLRHPRAVASLEVTVTASAAGHLSQSAHATLAVATYAGYR
jgi:Bacterial Ig-like domain (group 3)